jgi:hypothetical protein
MRMIETRRDDSPDDTSIHAGQCGRQGQRRTPDLPLFRTRDASPLSPTRVHDLHLSSDPNAAEPDEHADETKDEPTLARATRQAWRLSRIKECGKTLNL